MNFVVVCLLLFSFFTFYLAHGSFCPDLKTAIEFQTIKMQGVWYAVMHTNKNYADKVKCVTVKFRPEASNSAAVVWNGINKSDGKVNIVIGSLKPTDKPKVYNEVLYQTSGILSKPQDNNITILGTDHKTYFIAYACDEDKKQYSSWIITKESKLPVSLFIEINSILSNNGLDFKIYNVIDHNGCAN